LICFFWLNLLLSCNFWPLCSYREHNGQCLKIPKG
jgi:hypothetical protein